jgi:DUF305 family protein family protein
MALVLMHARRLARILPGLALVVALFWNADDPATGAVAGPLDPETADVGQRERLYLEISSAAMATMMRDMQTSGSGDVNRDFVMQMVAHHQGAIDMAGAMLRTGSNQQLIRLAHEIIVTQREEIAAMLLAIAKQSHSAGEPRRDLGSSGPP